MDGHACDLRVANGRADYITDGTDTDEENIHHKTILVGDSGVGKTSLLVQFDQGKFQTGSFAATVGIGFTVMLIGDSGVGKTCLLVRFKDNTFLSGNFISTVGIDFRNKVVDVDGTKVKLQIWDTAGQERFRSITRAYYRDAQEFCQTMAKLIWDTAGQERFRAVTRVYYRDAKALLLLYDVCNKASFDNIRAWLGEINEYAQDEVVIMLLGNKCDMTAERVIRTEDGERLAKEYGCTFMETSAKTGLNVELAFMAVARDLKAKRTRNPNEPKFSVSDYVNQEKKTGGCCGS